MASATDPDSNSSEHTSSQGKNSKVESKKDFRHPNIPADIFLSLNAAIKDLTNHVGSSDSIKPSLLTTVKGVKTGAQSFEAVNYTIFHPFPRLPPELRLRIWEAAAMAPRMIGVEDVPQDNTEDEERLMMWLDSVNINGI